MSKLSRKVKRNKLRNAVGKNKKMASKWAEYNQLVKEDENKEG